MEIDRDRGHPGNNGEKERGEQNGTCTHEHLVRARACD
jgi:hypothetical protein